MGYRSDVGFAVRTSVFTKALSDLPEEQKDLIFDLLKHADDVIDDGDGEDAWQLYIWEGLKWYEEEFAIGWINKFVENNPEDCTFIRIGESTSDIDDFGEHNDPYNLGFSRQITYQ